jgi:hypothetical protein
VTPRPTHARHSGIERRPVASGPARKLLGTAALGMFALLVVATARAAPPEARWAAVSVLAGSAQPVAGMADYQWDVRPHAAWGAQVLAGRGPVAAGLRWWRGGTTQAVGLAGVPDPGVRTGSIELVTHARVARWRTAQLLVTASGGRLAITYHPDRLTIVTGGTPVEVALEPVHAWVGGAGVALHLPLAGGWTWGLETERRRFSLDTAHQSGGTVTLSREAFGDWDTRVAMARAWNW